ncbi:hypothetical protein GCM10009107_35120 [Ideonella azotifigens]|uniref:Beta/gamma crystallin 'Greek key' domain-containing protein n=2 Tax=Ideonella azotifigens TaxID=513160 RepID=A0ABN1K6P9_9BURK
MLTGPADAGPAFHNDIRPMKPLFKLALAVLATAAACHASAEITFFEHPDFQGRAVTLHHPVDNFERRGFNDQASSVIVRGEPWEVCEHADFGGRCVVLRPGEYPSLHEFHLSNKLSSAREAGRDEGRYDPPPPPPIQAQGQVTLFEHDGFRGRSFSAEQDIPDFRRFGFNDRASSVTVAGGAWEVCEHPEYSGRCMILRPGRYPDLGSMGMNDRVSSMRWLRPAAHYEEWRYAPSPVPLPAPVPVYDWHRRPQERLVEVPVSAVHAVYTGPQQQRCWIEREQVVQREPNPAGALVGGVIGGILGHQIGGGHGSGAVGAFAGAVVGANAGGGTVVSTQGVQRCASSPPQGRPDYWDVTYYYRGVEHHVQTSNPPGPSLTISEDGEPRL